jgi:CRP/FNR family cyclic AMP-dependent transcriptional regulator
VLLGCTIDRLRDTNQHWAEFGGGTATHRIIALLLEMAVREGVDTSAGREITMASQEELAAEAATSRESMARVLRDLRDRGLVTTSRGRIVINDLAGLRRLAP